MAPPTPQAAAAATAPTPAATASDGSARVYVRTVEATADVRLVVKGSADANAVVRLYLNGAFVADATAGEDRLWSLTIERGMSPGLYTIRADEIDRAGGAVLARAEVPFSYPEHASTVAGSLAPAAPTPTPAPTLSPTLAAAQAAEPVAASAAAAAAPAQLVAPPPATAASGEANPPSPKSAAAAPENTPSPSPSAAPPANVVVANVQTTTVVRGDNLWDLARRFYGDGTRFRQIYAANATQIRDPSLIYIGQIFVVPKGAPWDGDERAHEPRLVHHTAD